MTNNSPGGRYTLGNAQNWLDDEVPAPVKNVPENRETFLRKTQEAAATVGYVAPSEQPKASFPVKEAPPKIKKGPEKAKAPVAEVSRGRRRGDRNFQMSVRIRQEHDDLIKSIAQEDFSVASIVEAAIVAFAKELIREQKYKRMPLDSDQLALARAVVEGPK